MNSLVISFVVGEILLLSILAYNSLVNTNSREMTMGNITQQNLKTIVELITNDFNKIGYKAVTRPVIEVMNATDFRFWADVFDGDATSASSIRWRWDTRAAVTATGNPNDFILQRTDSVSDARVTTVDIPVTYFNVRYLNDDGNPETNAALVRKIEVEIIVESPEPYRYDKNGNGYYYSSAWKRTFVPNNLNLPN